MAIIVGKGNSYKDQYQNMSVVCSCLANKNFNCQPRPRENVFSSEARNCDALQLEIELLIGECTLVEQNSYSTF